MKSTIQRIGFDAALQQHLAKMPDPTFIPVAKRAIEIFSEVCLGVRTRLDAHASFAHSDDLTPSEICKGLNLDAFVAHRCEEIVDAN